MKPVEQVFGKLQALVLEPRSKPMKVLVLLHGVGSNEQNLLDAAEAMTEDRLIISLRGPLTLGPGAYAWFHVQFTEQGPVHNWNEARASFTLLEEALEAITQSTGIGLDHISVYGFSQGAIMTIGLALASRLNLETYFAGSGRTLPEWAQFSKESPLAHYKARKIIVMHGVRDSKLPIALGRNTEAVLKSAGLDLTYKEYPSDHEISGDTLRDLKNWLKTP